jgi:uncharacterized protein (TIGR03437 family)
MMVDRGFLRPAVRRLFILQMKLIRISLFLLFFYFVSACFAQITLNAVPTRVLGQNSVQITNVNPNLVEGREFETPEGIALDTSTNPPALYVTDFNNSRVLGFRSATGFANGQKADIVLGQANLTSTFPQGPGRQRSTGLNSPSGIAVDAQGNVYVVDGGNNRILRFPKPFAQTGDLLPDIVIGQTSFSTNAANAGGVSASTLAFTATAANGQSTVLQAFLAFDAAGNLWVSDSGNNRVLRFNAKVLGSDASSGPAADVVLGQIDFVTNTYNPPPTNALKSLTSLAAPDGIAFDSAGRLFVAESTGARLSRILMWAPPFVTGKAASRLLGVDSDNPPPPAVSELQLSISPGGLFAIGNSIGVADSSNNRILVFPPVEQWTPNATYQAAIAVAGQPDFTSNTFNRGQPGAGPDRFSGPAAAAFFGAELYVADAFNNRVVVMPVNGTAIGNATRVLGQDQMNLNAPNLVEGREFDFSSISGSFDAGLAVDLTSTPPHLYVADTYNNRILGYADLRNFQSGAKADLVIGQPDFQQVLVNYPNNDVNRPNASGLFAPTGLAVDTDGNLYVADRGNGRVLRFPKPFANYTPGLMEQADLVLGQNSFTATRISDATDRTMAQPYGLAFTFAGGLLVSDIALSRVLYFQGLPANLKSGMPASLVFGQSDFSSGAGGSGLGQMQNPRHISTDVDDRLYVADSGNGRVLIFDHAPTAAPGQPAAQVLTAGLSRPTGVYVSAATGDIWVGDAGNGTAVRYPTFRQLAATGGASNATITDPGLPIAMVEDAWGDLFMADAVQRVIVYYPGLGPINAANFLYPNVLAPGMIAAMFTQGNFHQFGGQATNASSLPLPTTLNGVQVLFNGTPVPLFYADPDQINFQVPMGAPQSGLQGIQVLDAASGRVLGDTTILMQPSVPGIFTQAGNGSGAASVLNQDNTVNSQTNQAPQGTVVQIFGTGQGFLSGAPADGVAPTGPVPTTFKPTIIMGTNVVPDENIQYSGLAPGLVGVWQINVKIPDTVITLPTNPTQIIAIMNSQSTQPLPSGGGGLGRAVIIYVKQK